MLTETRDVAASSSVAKNGAALDELIARVRCIVQAEADQQRVGEEVADLLVPYLLVEDLLNPDQLEPDPAQYRQHILHVEPDGSFSVAALVWLPGQATAIHDHVSWCVVGVYRGAESETRYALAATDTEPHLREIRRTINVVGSVDALVPPGDIHQVANGSSGLAVSLHIYGADLRALGCSIRRCYESPVRP